MNRFMPVIVPFGFVTDCRLASRPTNRSPFFDVAIMDGVVLPPSEFSRIFGPAISMTATAEFVVPRSIPIIFAMVFVYLINNLVVWKVYSSKRSISSPFYFRMLADSNLGRTKHPSVQHVSLLNNRNDPLGLLGILGVNESNRLGLTRVK